MENNTKELILDAKITDEHVRGQDTLPYRYNPYFGTPFSTMLDISITAQKNGTASIRLIERQQAQMNTPFLTHLNPYAHG